MSDRACTAILDRGSILLIRQTYRGEMLWTFPGGRVEKDEEPKAAAIREVREETGLSIAAEKLLYQGPRRRGHGTYYCYQGRIIGGQLERGHDVTEDGHEEIYEIRWFAIDEVLDHPEVKLILPNIEQSIQDETDS